MRIALCLGFLLLLGFQEDPLGGLIRDLGSDDVEVRDEATTRLRKLGRKAHEALKAAERSPDTEVRGRARDLMDSMVTLEIDLAFDRNNADWNTPLQATLRLVNETGREILVFTGGFSYRVQILELFDENEQLTGRFGRRFGCGGGGCRLSESQFVLFPTGTSHAHDLGDLQGQPFGTPGPRPAGLEEGRLPPLRSVPGRYRIRASYQFHPDEYRSRCRRPCPGHDDPAKPWNVCAPRRLEAEAEFVILP